MSDNNEITIKIKLTNNNVTFDVKISPTASVSDLKKACVAESKLSIEEQNMVYKGRILANDKNINDYGVQTDHTIILVYSILIY
jgi:uncharacterized ubiquitin-like protein YukD